MKEIAKKFQASVAKIEREIDGLRSGTHETNEFDKAFLLTRKHVDALEDKLYRSELRGDEVFSALIKQLLKDLVASRDVAYEARKARRGQEMTEIREKELQRGEEAYRKDPAFYQYQEELKRSRIR